MSWLRRVFRVLSGSPEPVLAPQVDGTEGPLFGLSPPEGCHFEVSCHQNSSWFVYIYRGRSIIASDLMLIGQRFNPGKTDEELIIEAAKKALAKVVTDEARASLQGCYPPKRIKGSK